MPTQVHYGSDGTPLSIDVDGDERALDTADDVSRWELPPAFARGAAVRDVQTTIRSTLEEIKDSYTDGAIIVRSEASHTGYANDNGHFYVDTGYRKSVSTWLDMGGKPYLKNHDTSVDPMGRVVDAMHVSTGKGTGYHDLDIQIGDRKEIERVIDKRAFHVSVGHHAVGSVECSTCGKDLYGDGTGSARYELPKMPAKEWLSEKAPGIWGDWYGYTNAELWDVQKEEETKRVTAKCMHRKRAQAPMGGADFGDTHYMFHLLEHDEVSRVNNPADKNRSTGEYAHIREIVKAADSIADPEMRVRHIEDRLSQIPRGAVDRARFSIVSERDLFRPVTATEAVDFVAKAGDGVLFNTGLWNTVTARDTGVPHDVLVRAYYAAGGKFIGAADAPEPADPFQLSPSAFGMWLRASDFTREERRVLDAHYVRTCL